MLAKLTSKAIGLTDSEYTVTTSLSIGASQGNDITIDTPSVSSRHARIFYSARKQGYYVEDLKSRNGTRVDGSLVNAPEPLANLNVVTIADEFDFIFHALALEPTLDRGSSATAIAQEQNVVNNARTIIEEATISLPDVIKQSAGRLGQAENREIWQRPSDTETVEAEPSESLTLRQAAPLRSLFNKSSRFVLRFDHSHKSYHLNEGENIIGRDGLCDIEVPHSSISRRHAVITVKGNVITISDLGSKNSTFVAKHRIHKARAILPGTRIHFGRARAILSQVSR